MKTTAGQLTTDHLGRQITIPQAHTENCTSGMLVEVQHWAVGADRTTVVHLESDGRRTPIHLLHTQTVVVAE